MSDRDKARKMAERIMEEVIDQTIGVFDGEEREAFIEDFERIIMQEI